LAQLAAEDERLDDSDGGIGLNETRGAGETAHPVGTFTKRRKKREAAQCRFPFQQRWPSIPGEKKLGRRVPRTAN
jgi:hypothetical protein